MTERERSATLDDVDTPRCNALASNPLDSFDQRAWATLAYQLERDLEICRDAHMANCLAADTLRTEIRALRSASSATTSISTEFAEFIGRLSDLAHSADFWSDKPYGNRLYYGAGAGDYIAGDILQAFLHALKNAAPQVPESASLGAGTSSPQKSPAVAAPNAREYEGKVSDE